MKELALHILDIAQNSIRANATLVEIEIEDNLNDNRYQISIIDDGTGMDEDTIQKAIDPFYTSRTTRKVGLGLSMFKQNAEMCDGTFDVKSKLGEGSKVTATFIHNHLDRPVLGDIAGVVLMLVYANPELDFIYRHSTNNGEYIFNTWEVKEQLGEVPINTPEVKRYLEEMIRENLVEIGSNN
ncbi:ATP-binding protein [Prolixibacteraceae bacterium JC049]|nr:ATP-binding protein [Prolixibacteraceae bacterium JC049]